jgi:transcriptional regulator with XRE-family HTH domain
MNEEDSRSDNSRKDTVERGIARWERIISIVMIGTRKDRNISQERLADRVGRPRNSIANFESGRRPLRLAEFIVTCRALGEDPEVVLHRILRWEGNRGTPSRKP